MRFYQILLVIFAIAAVLGDVLFTDFDIQKSATSSVIGIHNKLSQVAPKPIDGYLSTVARVLCSQSDDIFIEEGQTMRETSLRIDRRIDEIFKVFETLQASVDQLKNEVKHPTLVEYIRELESNVERFKLIVIGFGSDLKIFQQKLDTFIVELKSSDVETKFSNYLNDAQSGLHPLRSVFIEVAGVNRFSNRSHAMSSPNQMIYNFHVAVLYKILSGNAFLLSCFELQKLLYQG